MLADEKRGKKIQGNCAKNFSQRIMKFSTCPFGKFNLKKKNKKMDCIATVYPDIIYRHKIASSGTLYKDKRSY